MFAFFDVCLHLKKVPPPKIPIRQPVNYLRVRFSMTTDNKTCHRIKKFCWQSNPKSPGLLFWVFYFRRTEFSTIHKAFSFGVAPSSSRWIRSSAINERNVWTSSTDNDTAILWLMQKGAFVETKAAFAGCADLNLAGRAVEEGLMSQVQWRSNDDFLRPISDQQSLHVTFW